MAIPEKLHLDISWKQNDAECGLSAELDYPLNGEKLKTIFRGLDLTLDQNEYKHKYGDSWMDAWGAARQEKYLSPDLFK